MTEGFIPSAMPKKSAATGGGPASSAPARGEITPVGDDFSPTAPRRATSRPALDARPFPHYTELNGISNYRVTPQRTHRRAGAAIPPASQWYRRYTHDTPGTFLALRHGAEPAAFHSGPQRQDRYYLDRITLV